MADRTIESLDSVSTPLSGEELLVAEQAAQAKKIEWSTLISELATELDGHGGIASISYSVSTIDPLYGAVNITLADGTIYAYPARNGNGIANIAIAYGIANPPDPSYVSQWYSSPVAPTDEKPYAFTRITITDSTNAKTYAYAITKKAINPTVRIGDVTANGGQTPAVSITNTGTLYNPVYNWDFTLPQGEQGETGDYIEPIVSYGTSIAAATQPSTWYNSPSSLSYAAGNFIWKKTEYTLHETQTVQSTVIEVIGYIGQNGTGSGSVNQITFNGDVFTDDGTGNVTITADAEDVGAIANPSNKSNGQVLTYDSTADEWVAANPATGNVNTVNNVGVTAGTTNIQLYGTAIPVSSSNNTSISDAIPQAATTNPAPLGNNAEIGIATKWAKADHVHARPTPSQIGAVSTSDVKYKIYSSVSDLNLTAGIATVAGVWDALENQNAILICNATDFSSGTGGVPSTDGTVIMCRMSSSSQRAFVKLILRNSTAEYSMAVGTDGNLSGTWLKTTVGIQTLTGTASSNSSGQGSVNFDYSFSSAPTVIITVTGPTVSQIFEARPNSITTTGFTFVVARYNGSAIAGYAANVAWVAIGQA